LGLGNGPKASLKLLETHFVGVAVMAENCHKTATNQSNKGGKAQGKAGGGPGDQTVTGGGRMGLNEG